MLAYKGGWQSSNRSNIIHHCGKYEKFCLGGFPYRSNPCSGGSGHFGPLCKSCDTSGIYYNGQRYCSTGYSNCNLCPDSL